MLVVGATEERPVRRQLVASEPAETGPHGDWSGAVARWKRHARSARAAGERTGEQTAQCAAAARDAAASRVGPDVSLLSPGADVHAEGDPPSATRVDRAARSAGGRRSRTAAHTAGGAQLRRERVGGDAADGGRRATGRVPEGGMWTGAECEALLRRALSGPVPVAASADMAVLCALPATSGRRVQRRAAIALRSHSARLADRPFVRVLLVASGRTGRQPVGPVPPAAKLGARTASGAAFWTHWKPLYAAECGRRRV